MRFFRASLFSALLFPGIISAAGDETPNLKGSSAIASDHVKSSFDNTINNNGKNRVLVACEDTNANFDVKKIGSRNCDWASKSKRHCYKKLANGGGRVYEAACPVACSQWFPQDSACDLNLCQPFDPNATAPEGSFFPARDDPKPSEFDFKAFIGDESKLACHLEDPASDPEWVLESSPTKYWYNIPEAAKSRGVVFLFHGGGGDHETWLTKTGSGRIIVNSILKDLGMGVVSPSGSKGGGWLSEMCDGREEGSSPRRAENRDIDNLYVIVEDLIDSGILDANTPIVTFGYSGGTSPALEFRTCGPPQVRLAMAGGTISTSWYGWNGATVTGIGLPETFGVDDTSKIPVHLSIGSNDVYKEIHRQLWENRRVPEYINKVTHMNDAFQLLQDAGIHSELCVSEPWPMSQDGDEFGMVCIDGAPIPKDDRAKLYDHFRTQGYIDDAGGICTRAWDDPARGFNSRDILEEAAAIVGAANDRRVARSIGDVITGAYGGHVPSLRCWPDQMALIRKVLTRS